MDERAESGYADRAPDVIAAGQPYWQNASDKENEDRAAIEIGEAWNLIVRKMPAYHPIDRYGERGPVDRGTLNSWIEIKCRRKTHSLESYNGEVYFGVQKYLYLFNTAVGTGIPAYWVARFTEGLYWINVASVPVPLEANRAGTYVRAVPGFSDQEAMIFLKTSLMHPIAQIPTGVM